ncbi:MAG: hypothetical protein ABIW38_03290 [Ferruginibacter sp.]
MPTPIQFKAPFIANAFYHIVCKSIDGILLFKQPQDYAVFYERFRKFNSAFFNVWSYSLLSNHTHHIVKIKSIEDIVDYLESDKNNSTTVSMNSFLQEPASESLLDTMLERQMNSFLVSYANYYNNSYKRKGGLFQKPFKRIQITDDAHLQQAVIYTNANAQKHKLVNDFTTYPYTSYTEVLLNCNSSVCCKDVIEFFGSRDQFIKIHKEQVEFYYNNNWPSSRLE